MNNLTRRSFIASTSAALIAASTGPSFAQSGIRRIPTQYIAALAPDNATSGTGAENWGLWRNDPGPIGVWLKDYDAMQAAGGRGPTGWKFDLDDWWLDENGLLMHPPEFPMPAAKFYVTNGRTSVSLLTVEEPDPDGKQSWSLSGGMNIAGVTHGPCRSARYTPEVGSGTCTPANAPQSVFPLKPRENPPAVEACNQQNYAVLIVFGVPNAPAEG